MKRIKTKLWKDSKSKKFADPQQNDRPNKFGSNRKKERQTSMRSPKGRKPGRG